MRAPDGPARRTTSGSSWCLVISRRSGGPADHAQIVLARNITDHPGRIRTRVIADGVEPQIQAHRKHSKVKQYFKNGHAPRAQNRTTARGSTAT